MGFQGTPLVRCRSWLRLSARRQMCLLLRLFLRWGHRHEPAQAGNALEPTTRRAPPTAHPEVPRTH